MATPHRKPFNDNAILVSDFFQTRVPSLRDLQFTHINYDSVKDFLLEYKIDSGTLPFFEKALESGAVSYTMISPNLNVSDLVNIAEQFMQIPIAEHMKFPLRYLVLVVTDHYGAPAKAMERSILNTDYLGYRGIISEEIKMTQDNKEGSLIVLRQMMPQDIITVMNSPHQLQAYRRLFPKDSLSGLQKEILEAAIVRHGIDILSAQLREDLGYGNFQIVKRDHPHITPDNLVVKRAYSSSSSSFKTLALLSSTTPRLLENLPEYPTSNACFMNPFGDIDSFPEKITYKEESTEGLTTFTRTALVAQKDCELAFNLVVLDEALFKHEFVFLELEGTEYLLMVRPDHLRISCYGNIVTF